MYLMALNLWQSIWEVQLLCKQLGFLISFFPNTPSICPRGTPSRWSLAMTEAGPMPRHGQASERSLGRSCWCQSQPCSVSWWPESLHWHLRHSSPHPIAAWLVRGLEIIATHPAGWVNAAAVHQAGLFLLNFEYPISKQFKWICPRPRISMAADTLQ